MIRVDKKAWRSGRVADYSPVGRRFAPRMLLLTLSCSVELVRHLWKMSKKFDIYSKIFFRDVENFVRHLCVLVLRHQMRVSNYFVNSFYSVTFRKGSKHQFKNFDICPFLFFQTKCFSQLSSSPFCAPCGYLYIIIHTENSYMYLS